MTQTKSDVSGWVGWVYFASMMMLIVGGLQIVSGLVALLSSDFFVVGQAGLVVWNYDAWGWIQLLIGTLLIVTAMSVLSGRTWARILASMIVVINAINNLLFLPAYPIWSIIALIIDGLVLYALTMHGRELREDY